LPLLGVLEKPSTPPATIEDDFNSKRSTYEAASAATPAE
jgi:ubiquinol-cytochrome c reductase cytochrome b subunit